MAAATAARAWETRCERVRPAGPSWEGRRDGEDAGELWGPPPLWWSCSPRSAGRTGKFASGQGLGDGQTDCEGTERKEGQARETEAGRDRETRRVRRREGYLGLTTEAERGNSPRSRTESRIRNSEAERGKRESRGQKRAEAQTEASARGDAGTRRERFGSVTVLPHLEDITSPLKKNKYKKGLDIKRRQILLSLEGGGEEVAGGNAEQMRPRGVAEPGAGTGEGARPAAQVPAGVAQGSPPCLPSFRIHAAQRTARCPGHYPGSCVGPGVRPRFTLHPRRVSLFSPDCDSARILRLGVVQRSASFCPRKCILELESPRWVFGAQRA